MTNCAAAPLLTAFGTVSVTSMMIFYALEQKARIYTLLFAAACFSSSAYGWLAGTWPFGIVESVWGIIAFRKWARRDSTLSS